jgi:hypothetical protein
MEVSSATPLLRKVWGFAGIRPPDLQLAEPAAAHKENRRPKPPISSFR